MMHRPERRAWRENYFCELRRGCDPVASEFALALNLRWYKRGNLFSAARLCEIFRRGRLRRQMRNRAAFLARAKEEIEARRTRLRTARGRGRMGGWRPVESESCGASVLRKRAGGRQSGGNLNFQGDCTLSEWWMGNRFVRKRHPPEVLEHGDSCGARCGVVGSWKSWVGGLG